LADATRVCAAAKAIEKTEGLTAAVKHAKSEGYHIKATFYEALGVDGHDTIIADVLHQLLKGATKDICIDELLFKYLELITLSPIANKALVNRLNRHLACQPLCSRQRQFHDGIQFL